MSSPPRDPRLPFTQLEDSFLAPRDPIVGYVKVGGKDQRIRYNALGKPWLPPTRFVDPAHFVVTTREKHVESVKGKAGSKSAGETFNLDRGYKIDEAFHRRVQNAKPASLKVRLMWPTWAENFIAFLGAYSGTEWVCRGNGVEALDVKRGEVSCPCPRLKQFSGTYDDTPPHDGKKKSDGFLYPCKPHGTLTFILEEAETFGGFWAFKTTSFESISNITKTLRNLERLFGRVDGLPLELRVFGATKSFGGGMTTQPIVTLVLAASMDQARQLAAGAAEESAKYLPLEARDAATFRAAVVAEMEEEAKSYADEFIPELGGEEEEAHVATVDEEEPEDAGPDVEIVQDSGEEPEEAEEEEEAAPEPEEPEGPEEPEEKSPEQKLEETCGAILAAAGWESSAIEGRLEFHRKSGTLEELLERLRKNVPDAYAAVIAPELLEEPEDELKL